MMRTFFLIYLILILLLSGCESFHLKKELPQKTESSKTSVKSANSIESGNNSAEVSASKREEIPQKIESSKTSVKSTTSPYAELEAQMEEALSEFNKRKKVTFFLKKKKLKLLGDEPVWNWFKDGDEAVDIKYEGEFKGFGPDGQGTLTYPDGRTYEGEFKEGRQHGQGTLTLSDGTKYEGEWKDDKQNGQGIFTLPNGDRYEGEFRDQKFNGKGTYIWSAGNKYMGEWKDDKRNGKGTYYFKDGTEYQGEWKEGKKHGQGILTIIDGRKYEGEFKDDKQNGYGILSTPNGISYKGKWKDGLRHGQGILILSDGTKYEGIFKDGQKWTGTLYGKDGKTDLKFVNGKSRKNQKVIITEKEGILYYRLVNGSWSFFEKGDDEKDSKYIGDIRNKQPNGKGTINLPYGKYVGEWKNGLFDGFGIFDYFDGSKYIGNYKSGKTNGQGFWSMATGTIFSGEFKDDLMEGNGIITYKNGIQFIGKLRKGMPLQGTLIMPDGSSFVGELKEGNKMWNGQMFIIDHPYIPKYTDGKESIVKKQEEILYRWTTNSGFIWKSFGNKLTDWSYFGQVSNGIPNGQGILTLPGGSTYRGGIVDGNLHGVGEMDGKEDGISLKSVGEFKFGKANGQGLGIFEDGSFVLGEFREDQPWEAMYLDVDHNIIDRWTNGIKKIKLDNLY